ncbi:Nn.00g042010.m01.CDS01 [Neocucurbitaria sp. VM-36]
MDGPIASAVVLPDDLPLPASPPYGHKRRQSSISDEHAKRPRLDDDAASTEGPQPTNGSKPAAPVRRERGRERRLFGAVLGALSQNPTTAAQKRRSEIEKRQLAQRKLEHQESEQRKAERMARRKVQRWKEQKYFEKESMRVRHENLLSMAHFLQTEAEPRLYYKPWETSPDEEDRIRDQIAEAHEIIEREVEEYDALQRQGAQREQLASADGGGTRDAVVSYSGKNYDAGAAPKPYRTNGGTNGSATSPEDLDMRDDHAEDPGNEAVRDATTTEDAVDSSIPSHETTTNELSKDDDDENGEDVMEEAAEDTVIY